MILLAACAIWFVGGLLCLFLRGRSRLANVVGPASAVVGSIVGFIAMPAAFLGGESYSAIFPWQVPFGSIYLSVDALSAVFAIPILVIGALAAVYGGKYLTHCAHPERVGRSWFFFNALIASMFVVVLARNAILFLLAWEIMSLASFFLVMFEHEKPEVRRAGFTYLIATHLSAFFLLIFFLSLGKTSGSFDFGMMRLAGLPPFDAGMLFVLALVGFGTKAGIIPVHVWLPEAHPAAPSHVSAVMSGVMIKTGIYGLLRVATFFGAPPDWWGWTMIGLGAVSGVIGVLFAIAQHDLKRLLAYHSVENIGIICLGLGLGWLGAARGNILIATLGFAGAMLHVVNHAIFKSLLFMSGGVVAHATGTREIDRLGGLLKRMPKSGFAFLIGAISICGLPPFNGFVSEFLIYAGSFRAVIAKMAGAASSGGLVAIGALALIGGLALACFTKVFGIVFLGEPRSSHAQNVSEAGPAMTLPMFALSFLCLLIGLAGSYAVRIMSPAINILLGSLHSSDVAADLAAVSGWLMNVAIGAAALVALIALISAARCMLNRSRIVRSAVTWDCGYAAPNERMQYTSSSFAQPITNLFGFALGTSRKTLVLQELFPKDAEFSTETPDIWRRRFYDPVFRALGNFFTKFHWLQHGRINLYILCIVLALLVLLGWKLR